MGNCNPTDHRLTIGYEDHRLGGMSVDMFPIRFLEEVDRLPEHRVYGKPDSKVQKHGIPAWKAPFMEAVSACHSSYTLPTFDSFRERMLMALLRNNENDASQFADTFVEHHAPMILDANAEPNEGFLYRLSELYEGGIAELYAYCMLVFAFEDQIGSGIVLNDMRVDWKLKLDALVICNGRMAGIDMHYARPGTTRMSIEKTRRGREMASKRNIPVRDVDNDTIAGMQKFVITRDQDDNLPRNGYRLFSNSAIDGLLLELYEFFDVDPAAHITHEILHKWPYRGG